MAEQVQALSPTLCSKPTSIPTNNNQQNTLRQSSEVQSSVRQSPTMVSSTQPPQQTLASPLPDPATAISPANNVSISPPAKRPLFHENLVKNGNSSPTKTCRIVKKDGSPGLKLHIRKEDLLRPKPKKHKHRHHHKHHERDHNRHHHHKPKNIAADVGNIKGHNLSKHSQTDLSSNQLTQIQSLQTSSNILANKNITQAKTTSTNTTSNESNDSTACVPPKAVAPPQPQTSGNDADYMVKNANSSSTLNTACEFDKLIHIETQANGGASVVHVYSEEIAYLKGEALERFANYFFQIAYGEKSPGVANHVMGIVHGAAAYLPDFIDYFALKHPNTICKTQPLGKSDILTTTMPQFQKDVARTYCNGTFRTGPLLQLSLVGTVNEEVGDFFEDFLDLVESNPFLRHSMPWGPLSAVDLERRNQSNDGPILWVRPGEQMVPTADLPKSPAKSKRR